VATLENQGRHCTTFIFLTLDFEKKPSLREFLTGSLWRNTGDAAWARTDPACASPTLERQTGTRGGKGTRAHAGLTNRPGRICTCAVQL
jgi:hypothetical protein